MSEEPEELLEDEEYEYEPPPSSLVCLRLDNDDMIVCETNGVADNTGFIIIYNPFRIVMHKSGQWMIFPMNPLRMTGGAFSLQSSTIRYVSLVDKQHVQAYATMLFSVQISMAKDVLSTALANGTCTRRFIDEVFITVAEYATIITERYKLQIPLDQLRSQLYEFILETMKPASEVHQ